MHSFDVTTITDRLQVGGSFWVMCGRCDMDRNKILKNM